MNKKKKSVGHWIIHTWNVVSGSVAVIFGIMLIISAYSGYISPRHFSLSAYMALTFPMWLVLNLGLLLFWLISLKRHLLIPLVSILITLPATMIYLPINRIGKVPVENIAPDSLLKVLTYNVHSFSHDGFEFNNSVENKSLQLIKAVDADIVCLQEFGYSKDERFLTLKAIRQELKQYPYYSKSTRGQMGSLATGIIVFSKFPIKQVQRIDFEDTDNSAIICMINVHGKPYMVINCHLESNRFTQAERSLYESAITSLHSDQITAAKEAIVPKMGGAMKRRAMQADSLATIIGKRSMPVIVCGDFNDPPLSYSYRRVRGSLNDSFVEKGFGPGFTFKKNLFLVRIDHILYSQELETVESKILKGGSSDHSPLVSTFRILPPHIPESN